MSQKPYATPLAAAFLAVALCSFAQADPTYTVVASIRISDSRTTPLAVNETGQVAGYRAYTIAATSGHHAPPQQGWNAFLTSADGATPLDVAPLTGTGTVTSGRCRGQIFTNAFTAVNAAGDAVGESTVAVTTGTTTTATSYFQHAVVYSGTTQTDLGTLGGPSFSSTATGINASGLIVGVSDVSRGVQHAFSSDGTTLTDLGTLGGKYSAAAAVNDAGTIVGGSTLATRKLHPFSYSGGAITDLGLPTGFSEASATAIASNGAIVGYGSTSKGIQSFLFTGGAFTNLGTLYSSTRPKRATPIQATGINASGIVVGNTLDASGRPRAFIYSGTTLSDLNTGLPTAYAGWKIVSAVSISDSGYISTIATDAAGKQYGLLLKLASS